MLPTPASRAHGDVLVWRQRGQSGLDLTTLHQGSTFNESFLTPACSSQVLSKAARSAQVPREKEAAASMIGVAR